MRLVLVAALLLSASACGPDGDAAGPQADDRSPAEVAEAVVLARLDGDHPEAYALSSSTDRAARDSSAYVATAPNTNTAVWRAGREASSYQLGQPVVIGDSASVPVTLEVVDTDAIGQDFMAELFSGRLGQDPDEAAVESAMDRLYSGAPPMTTKRETVELVREAGSWRAVRGWDYGQYLELSGVAHRTEYEMTFVTGAVRNAGSQTVSSLRGTAYFHGPDGGRTGEQMVYLLGSELDAPLRPGYVKEFESYLESAPSAGVDSVSIELNDFTFSD
ncbi:hypothetical protein [Rubrivirga sp. IMCC43871]|uniref:hypothetical protein n=1 Tax=Rubrivirga sp. IMCC43871 TaxID=3391575 RepID=UPI00399005B1